MRDASHHTQVIVTSHSPELLDDKAVDSDSILVVVSEEGATRIGRLTEADRSVLRDHLFTAGELMRQTRLTPEANTAIAPQARLFDEP